MYFKLQPWQLSEKHCIGSSLQWEFRVCLSLAAEFNLFHRVLKCYQFLRRCIKKFPDYFHRPPTNGTTWICALCLRTGNVATQYAKWRRCVNIGSCTTRVFVTTCAVTFAISAWTWNWNSEQTWQIRSGDFWNVMTCVWKWGHVLCDVFRVARVLQERQNITRRRREVRATFH